MNDPLLLSGAGDGNSPTKTGKTRLYCTRSTVLYPVFMLLLTFISMYSMPVSSVEVAAFQVSWEDDGSLKKHKNVYSSTKKNYFNSFKRRLLERKRIDLSKLTYPVLAKLDHVLEKKLASSIFVGFVLFSFQPEGKTNIFSQLWPTWPATNVKLNDFINFFNFSIF